MKPWISSPDSEGYWWYSRGANSETILLEIVMCCGALTVCADGYRDFKNYSGLWIKAEPPQLPS